MFSDVELLCAISFVKINTSLLANLASFFLLPIDSTTAFSHFFADSIYSFLSQFCGLVEDVQISIHKVVTNLVLRLFIAYK